MNEVIEKKGDLPGETNMVIVGTHGNEICGIKALEELLPSLEIEKGVVFFAYGNPNAIKQNVRFTDRNLNRMYRPAEELSDEDKKSYEYERALYLQKYLTISEHVLDVHASSNKESRPFIICEKNAEKVYKNLPIETVVHGFDEHEPGGTDYYMNRIGKIGICVECGYLGEESSTATAKECILNFLASRGHITKQIEKPLSQNHFQIYKLYKTKTGNFNLTNNFSDFQIIQQGEVIGLDGEEEILCDRKSIILFAHNTQKPDSEAFILGEKLA